MSEKIVQMVHPDGSLVPIQVSRRHNGGDAVRFYEKKGFKTVEQHAADQAREAEMAKLREENERLKAGKGK